MRTSIRHGAALLGALTLASASLLQLGVPAAATSESHDPAAAPTATLTRSAFHDAMRKLWEDHITWTRLYIVSAATGSADLPDIGPTTDRLLANQVDIGNAIKPFYGIEAGDQLTALLRDHILTAAEIISDARAGKTQEQAAAAERWYANGNEIAAFLSSANPDGWPLAEMQAHMKSHLDLTLAEAVARLEGRYADEVVAYDAVHADILQMADMLSDGIIAQFPELLAD
jgi:hypothetical protein